MFQPKGSRWLVEVPWQARGSLFAKGGGGGFWEPGVGFPGM